jgi:hypothetical protein
LKRRTKRWLTSVQILNVPRSSKGEKSSKRIREGSRKKSNAFVFKTIGGKVQILEKIAFGGLARRNCLAKDFFVTLQAGTSPEIASRVHILESWRNVTLPFPVKFDTLKIVMLSNSGNATTICFPEFRVYQRLGFERGVHQ